MRNPLIILAILSLACARNAVASVMGVSPEPTIEWLVADSTMIVHAEVIDFSQVRNHWGILRVKPLRWIKGQSDEPEISVGVPTWPFRQLQDSTSRQFIIPLHRPDWAREGLAEPVQTMLRDVKWIVRDRLFNPCPPIPFDTTKTHLLRIAGNRVERVPPGEPTLLALKEELAKSQSPTIATLHLTIPASARTSPFDGEFILPVNDRTIGVARTWIRSTDPLDRLNAVRILSCVQSDEHISLLRSVLNDPSIAGFYHGVPGPTARPLRGKWEERVYTTRLLAATTLRNWNADPGEMIVLRCKYEVTLMGPALHITLAAAAVLFLGLILLIRPLRVRFVTSLCTLLLVCIVALWVRSAWHIDELQLKTGQDRLEATSLPGRLRLTFIRDWNRAFPFAYTSTPCSNLSLDDWLYTGSKSRWRQLARFGRDEGMLYAWSAVPYVAYSVPYWFIALLLATPLLQQVVRAYRHRFKPGHCRKCGYDLRATPKYCPECGTAA